jgi:hypothetical protein
MLPTIAVLLQLESMKETRSAFRVNLGGTLIGSTREKTMALQNGGLIRVWTQMHMKPRPDFLLVDMDPTEE